MPGRTVELVAAGPPPLDPYGPGASAWALAEALSASGEDVHVLHLPGSGGAAAPRGVAVTALDIPLRRPGAPIEPAEFAVAAGRRLRRSADLVLRDPAGLGALGLARRRKGPPVVGAFVRTLELKSFEGEHRSRSPAGVVDRLDTWRDHRAVRRLERAALDEADRLFYDAPEVAKALSEEYGVPARKMSRLLSAAPVLPTPPTRKVAREELRIPQDVPVVVALTAFEAAEPSGADRLLEAFRRVRPFFPGVRLVLWGTTPSNDPGVVSVPERTATNAAIALASADLALFARRAPGFDPGIVLAARAGVPPILAADVRVPVEGTNGVRSAATDDPGDLASALAELLADPAQARELGKAALQLAEEFRPEKVAEALLRAATPMAA